MWSKTMGDAPRQRLDHVERDCPVARIGLREPDAADAASVQGLQLGIGHAGSHHRHAARADAIAWPAPNSAPMSAAALVCRNDRRDGVARGWLK
jgi:hypothetical protein